MWVSTRAPLVLKWPWPHSVRKYSEETVVWNLSSLILRSSLGLIGKERCCWEPSPLARGWKLCDGPLSPACSELARWPQSCGSLPAFLLEDYKCPHRFLWDIILGEYFGLRRIKSCPKLNSYIERSIWHLLWDSRWHWCHACNIDTFTTAGSGFNSYGSATQLVK